MKHKTAVVAAGLLLAAAGGAWGYFPYGPGKGTNLTVAGVNLAPATAPAASGPAAAAPAGQRPPGAPGAGGGPPPVPVEAAAPRVGQSRDTVTAVGTFRSNESVMVRPELASRIKAFNFDEGQKVRKGQVLVQLDASIEEAATAQAEAALALSKANYDRAVALGARQVTTERAIDEARAALRRDEAALALARARLDKFTLVAPWDGVMGLRRASVGGYINAGQDIVNLEQIDPLKVDFRVPENFLGAVRVGQTIAVTADAFPGKEFPGRVYAIDPLVDEAGRAVVIRAHVDNPGDVMRPGVFARVALALAVRDNALFVPEQALMPVGDRQTVFKIVEGRVQAQVVRIGRRQGTEVEIVDGLAATDTVVTAGHLKIRPGAPARVVPPGFQPGAGRPPGAAVGPPPGAAPGAPAPGATAPGQPPLTGSAPAAPRPQGGGG